MIRVVKAVLLYGLLFVTLLPAIPFIIMLSLYVRECAADDTAELVKRSGW